MPEMSRAEPSSRFFALVVASAFFMENLDATVIVTAMPAMAKSFGTDTVSLTIGVTGYLVALAVCIPASAWLADRFGARVVFASAIAAFTLASVLCALSTDLWMFATARIAQGASAALMSPVGRLVVLRTTAKSDLVRAIALITWPGLIAPVIGPPLGGLIATYASWRWIFILNIPLGIIGALVVARTFPSLQTQERRPFDTVGFALIAVALAALVYAVEMVSHGGAPGYAIAALFAGGLVSAFAAYRHIARSSAPILDFRPFRIPTFAATTLWGGGAFRLTSGAMPYLLPLFFQIGFGLSAVTAGFLVLAYAAGNLAMKSVTTTILRLLGFRRVLVGNGMIAAACIIACAALRPDLPEAVIVLVLFAAGCARSMQLTGLATLTFVDVPDAQKSSATTLSIMSHQLSMSLGVAASAMILNLGPAWRGTGREQLVTGDFRMAFLAMAVFAAGSALRFIALDRMTGAEVSGYPGPAKPGLGQDLPRPVGDSDRAGDRS